MKKIVLFAFTVLLLTSCSSNKGNYQQFYNNHVDEADFALGFPKWAVMPFIDKEDKEMVKELSEGMRRIRLLYNEDSSDKSIQAAFQDYAKEHDYLNHLYIKSSDEKIDLFTKEDEDSVREIVLSVNSDGDNILIAILGKMPKAKFRSKVGPKLIELHESSAQVSSVQ